MEQHLSIVGANTALRAFVKGCRIRRRKKYPNVRSSPGPRPFQGRRPPDSTACLKESYDVCFRGLLVEVHCYEPTGIV